MPSNRIIDIVTHYVPPVTGPAWNRIRGFAEAAAGRGYQIRFTTPNADPRDLYYSGDQTGLPPDWQINRVSYFDPSRLLRRTGQAASGNHTPTRVKPASRRRRAALWLRNQMELPDHRRLWNHRALRALLDQDPSPQIVLTTSPYNSTHLIGNALKQKRNLFWIADFRDPWDQLWHKHNLSAMHRAYNTSLEERILRNADLLTYFDMGGIDAASRRHGDWVASKAESIYHGLPAAEVAQLASLRDTQRQTADDPVFRLVYAGSLPENQWPDFLPETLQRFQVLLGKPLQFDVYGRSEPVVVEALRQMNTPDITVTHHDVKPREEILPHLAAADALLVLCGPAREMISSKIFESMALGCPMIYVGHPESGGARILRESGLPEAPVPSYDFHGLESRLTALADGVQAHNFTGFSAPRFPETYIQETQAARLWDEVERQLSPTPN